MLQIIKKIYWKIRNYTQRTYKRMMIYKKDLVNKLKFGWSAPLYNERIWVDPRKIEFMIDRKEVKRITGLHRNKASGVIVNWSEVNDINPITDDFRIRYCYEHWKENKSWKELGVIEYMSNTSKYGSWPRKKIAGRFEMLDQAFQETKNEGRLKTREELDPCNFRESEGVLVHIGTDGELFFGGNGFHRLAIAKVLELKKIPACVGLVDRNALGYLDKYRNPN